MQAVTYIDWPMILNYALGGTNLFSLYLLYKTRSSHIKTAEANALTGIQNVYDKFVSDMEAKYNAYRQEAEDLRRQLREHQQKCMNCQTK